MSVIQCGLMQIAKGAFNDRNLIPLWGQFPEACFVLDWVSVIDTSQLAAG